jgi:hypothetical protein
MPLVAPHRRYFAQFIPANRSTYFRVCPKAARVAEIVVFSVAMGISLG